LATAASFFAEVVTSPISVGVSGFDFFVYVRLFFIGNVAPFSTISPELSLATAVELSEQAMLDTMVVSATMMGNSVDVTVGFVVAAKIFDGEESFKEIDASASVEIFILEPFSPPEILFNGKVVSLSRSLTELLEAAMSGMVGVFAKSVVGKLSTTLGAEMILLALDTLFFFFLEVFVDEERTSKSSSVDRSLLPAASSSKPEGQT
jgi:hypothetical protein